MKTAESVSKEFPPPQWELEWRVVAVATEQCGLDHAAVTPDSRLVEDLGIDSLELVELILALEEAFGVSLPDEAAPPVFTRSPVTLRDMALFVRQRWGTGAPPRKDWRRTRESESAADPVPGEEMPFTQRSGRLDAGAWQSGPLYESLGPNREGHAQYRRRTDGMRCVLIPAARAWTGADAPEAPPDQRPAHAVTLSAFLMDAEPVSHAAYCRFLNSVGDLPARVLADWCGVAEGDRRGRQFPLRRGWREWEPIPKTERQPMMLVSWWGANAYSLWAHRRDWRCFLEGGQMPAELQRLRVQAEPPPAAWMHSHLPSEAQWEHAARGGGAAPAPAENAQSLPAGARVARHAAGTHYDADTLPAAGVSERRGMSPFGLHHMAGNVWQWCRDWYASDFYRRPEASRPDPQNAEPTGIRSERGGSWVGPAELALPWHRRGRPPGARGRCLGFRCVGGAEGR